MSLSGSRRGSILPTPSKTHPLEKIHSQFDNAVNYCMSQSLNCLDELSKLTRWGTLRLGAGLELGLHFPVTALVTAPSGPYPPTRPTGSGAVTPGRPASRSPFICNSDQYSSIIAKFFLWFKNFSLVVNIPLYVQHPNLGSHVYYRFPSDLASRHKDDLRGKAGVSYRNGHVSGNHRYKRLCTCSSSSRKTRHHQLDL